MRWTETKPAQCPIDLAYMNMLLQGETPSMTRNAILAATDYAETAMGRSLIQRTVTATFYANLCPPDLLYLPRGPIITVTSVTPAGGAALDPSRYALEYVGNATARLRVDGAYRFPKDLTVVYEAGYPIGTAPKYGSNVPHDIRHAIAMHALQLIQFREPIVAGASVAKVPNSLDDFYAQRTWEVGVG